ncbi:MAG: ABC transporter permease, partial [Oscillospiraceae bacterium]
LILGVLLTRIPTISKFVLPVLSVFQTIPGIVFIGILFIYIGMVPATVLIALSIYAIFPVLKNTYAGILNVDEKYREAARGCGMSDWQILLQVEIPLAMPTIITGLRMSTVYTVSWAVLAAMIGQGGLGEFIYRGLGTNNNTLIIIGAVPAAIMAVLLGLLIDRLQKAVTPRGMRKGG